jgi:hypothetical protein
MNTYELEKIISCQKELERLLKTVKKIDLSNTSLKRAEEISISVIYIKESLDKIIN